MIKKSLYTILLIFIIPMGLFGQQDSLVHNKTFVIRPELAIGILSKPNKNFVKHGIQTQAVVNFVWQGEKNRYEWQQRLKSPRTGFSVGYTNLGNLDSLGSIYTALPFIEFGAFKSKSIKMQIGMGVSYLDKTYDSILNPNNQGISTHLAWSFRAFMYYQMGSINSLDWRLGLGYAHHSNGHARLPNQGLNSFLIAMSADIKKMKPKRINENYPMYFESNTHKYLSLRIGYGENVLSKAYNDRKGVTTISGEYGKIFNSTFKFGFGAFYRFYGHYYDYIRNNESLVQDGEEFDFLKKNPTWNASNLGAFISGELLLSHIGIEAQLGFNIHKPAFPIDWRINQGWSYLPRNIPENAVLGEFNTKYSLEKLINTRLGLKYYLTNTTIAPKSNIYLGFHINSNLGQADFADFSLGYVRRFGTR